LFVPDGTHTSNNSSTEKSVFSNEKDSSQTTKTTPLTVTQQPISLSIQPSKNSGLMHTPSISPAMYDNAIPAVVSSQPKNNSYLNSPAQTAVHQSISPNLKPSQNSGTTHKSSIPSTIKNNSSPSVALPSQSFSQFAPTGFHSSNTPTKVESHSSYENNSLQTTNTFNSNIQRSKTSGSIDILSTAPTIYNNKLSPSVNSRPTSVVEQTYAPSVKSRGESFRPVQPITSNILPQTNEFYPCNLDTIDREQTMNNILRSLSENQSYFENPTSPHSYALEWITHEHDSNDIYLCPDSINLIQRYVVVLLYFQTGGDNWNYCARDEENGGLCVADNVQRNSFLTLGSECAWGGITCDENKKLQRINLDTNNLAGPIPPEISFLSELIELDLDSNKLTGTIPPSISLMSKLKYIDLDRNQLQGSIPETIYSLTQLRILDLNDNKLIGTISTKIGYLIKLDIVQLDNNMFTGNLPSEIGLLTGMRAFTVLGNNLTGTISSSICKLQNKKLKYFSTNCSICPIDGCCTYCEG